MIGDLAREGLASRLDVSPTLARIFVSLHSLPLPEMAIPTEENDIRQTNLQFFLCFIPKASFETRKPFMLWSDLFPPRKAIRFSTLESLREMSKTDDRVKFVLKYVKITQQKLDTCKRLVRFHFPLEFDAEKYDADVRENAKKLGIEIKGTVFSNEDIEKEAELINKIYFENIIMNDHIGQKKKREAMKNANN